MLDDVEQIIQLALTSKERVRVPGFVAICAQCAAAQEGESLAARWILATRLCAESNFEEKEDPVIRQSRTLVIYGLYAHYLTRFSLSASHSAEYLALIERWLHDGREALQQSHEKSRTIWRTLVSERVRICRTLWDSGMISPRFADLFVRVR